MMGVTISRIQKRNQVERSRLSPQFWQGLLELLCNHLWRPFISLFQDGSVATYSWCYIFSDIILHCRAASLKPNAFQESCTSLITLGIRELGLLHVWWCCLKEGQHEKPSQAVLWCYLRHILNLSQVQCCHYPSFPDCWNCGCEDLVCLEGLYQICISELHSPSSAF